MLFANTTYTDAKEKLDEVWDRSVAAMSLADQAAFNSIRSAQLSLLASDAAKIIEDGCEFLNMMTFSDQAIETQKDELASRATYFQSRAVQYGEQAESYRTQVASLGDTVKSMKELYERMLEIRAQRKAPRAIASRTSGTTEPAIRRDLEMVAMESDHPVAEPEQEPQSTETVPSTVTGRRRKRAKAPGPDTQVAKSAGIPKYSAMYKDQNPRANKKGTDLTLAATGDAVSIVEHPSDADQSQADTWHGEGIEPSSDTSPAESPNEVISESPMPNQDAAPVSRGSEGKQSQFQHSNTLALRPIESRLDPTAGEFQPLPRGNRNMSGVKQSDHRSRHSVTVLVPMTMVSPLNPGGLWDFEESLHPPYVLGSDNVLRPLSVLRSDIKPDFSAVAGDQEVKGLVSEQAEEL